MSAIFSDCVIAQLNQILSAGANKMPMSFLLASTYGFLVQTPFCTFYLQHILSARGIHLKATL
jgi:hypothetical protein